MDEYRIEEFGVICNLLHQAIHEQLPEPDLARIEAGQTFTGDAERAFAVAILEGVLGLESPLLCLDCEGDPELYMVRDDVWIAAGLKYDDGWACIACLSRRLGRKLRSEDFDDVPANDWIRGAFEALAGLGMMHRVACIGGNGSCADGGLAVPGTSRCRNHLPDHGWNRYKLKHPDRAAFYASGAWRDMRARHLADNPDCVVCGKPATHADHIRNLASGGTFDGPLQALCADHHRRKTQNESKDGNRRAAARRRQRG